VLLYLFSVITGYRWEDNIKMDLSMDCIDLAQDRDQWKRAVLNTIMNVQVP
jgi:hypothetical protein